jgi:hypothetical protein
LPKASVMFFDPARRTVSRKWSRSGEDTSPPVSFMRSLPSNTVDSVVAKLSPAVDRSIADEFDAELKFVSIGGECKEALLLTGKFSVEKGISAVQLPGRDIFRSDKVGSIKSSRSSYIFEPDPAVIRAGLTGALAASLSGWQCDPHNDYFFADEPHISRFATCYRVKMDIPYSKKALQSALTGAGHVILKQRGFPQSIEQVRKQLKLSGQRSETVILAGFSGEKFAFLVERLTAAAEMEVR